MIPVAIYARVSSEEQARGDSVDDQITACTRYAGARDGWQITQTYREEGVSAKDFVRRPVWQQVEADARAGRFKVLLVWKINRFSRATLRDGLDVLERLHTHGVQLVSINENFDFSTPMGQAVFGLFLAFARQYLIDLSGDVTRAKRAHVLDRGRALGNQPRMGYVRVDGKNEFHPEFAPVIRAALTEQWPGGQHSIGTLTQWIAARGVRNHRGKPYSLAGIYESLRSRWYLGEVSYQGMTGTIDQKAPRNRRTRKEAQWVKGDHPAMITEQQWLVNQTVLHAHAHHHLNTARVTGRVYLLSRMAICSECGGVLVGVKGYAKSTYYYQCRATARSNVCANASRSIREDRLMPQINAAVVGLRVSDRVLDAAAMRAAADQANATREKRADELRAERRRFIASFQRGWATEKKTERAVARVDADLLRLTPLTPDAIQSAGAEIGSIVDAWQAAATISDDSTRRGAQYNLLTAVIDRIRVDLKTGKAHIDIAAEYAPYHV